MKIAVFCSANNNIDKTCFDATRELGMWIAQKGYTIVYGGCNDGLMGCVGQTVHEHGGTTIGVVPRILTATPRVANDLDVTIPCENLADRKELMLSQSDICLALPGGIGTMDEIFTVVAARTIGYHCKPMIVFNVDGCWDAFADLLDSLQTQGMIRGNWRDLISMANSVDEVKALISSFE